MSSLNRIFKMSTAQTPSLFRAGPESEANRGLVNRQIGLLIYESIKIEVRKFELLNLQCVNLIK